MKFNYYLILICICNTIALTAQNFQYDFLNRLVSTTYQDSTVIEYCYDELGNRTCYNVSTSQVFLSDIYIHNPNLSIADLCQDASFTITYTEENLGSGGASGFFTEYYLSEDNSLDVSSDLFLGQLYSPSLEAGLIHTVTNVLEVPVGTSPGFYYLFMAADATEILGEISETNNIISTEIEINNGIGFDYDVTIVPSSCFQNNGSISIGNLTGQPPYDYLWSHDSGLHSSTAHNLGTGLYYVTIEDYNGCREVDALLVESGVSNPVSSFSYTSDSLDVVFSNSSSFGDNYYWDFGDGMTSSQLSPSYTFQSEGDYQVCLTSTNACGDDVFCSIIEIDFGCFEEENITLESFDNEINFSFDKIVDSLELHYKLLGATQFTTISQTAISDVLIQDLSHSQRYEIILEIFMDCGTYIYEFDVITPNTFYEFDSEDFIKHIDTDESIDPIHLASLSHIYIVGESNDSLYLIQTDDFGRVNWSRSIYADKDFNSMAEFSDSTVLLVTFNNNEAFMTRISPTDGIVIWNKKLDVSSWINAGPVVAVVDTDDNILFSARGETNGNSQVQVLIKFDINGNKIWNQVFRNLNLFPSVHHVSFQENAYFLGGYLQLGSDIFVAKVDTSGNMLWDKRIPSNIGQFNMTSFEVFNVNGVENYYYTLANINQYSFPSL